MVTGHAARLRQEAVLNISCSHKRFLRRRGSQCGSGKSPSELVALLPEVEGSETPPCSLWGDASVRILCDTVRTPLFLLLCPDKLVIVRRIPRSLAPW